MPYVKAAEYERLKAADDFCWSMILAISLGLLNRVPIKVRDFLVKGGLADWTQRCVNEGLMKEE